MVQFTASGGDGSYVWSTPESKFFTISQSGLADARLDQLSAISSMPAAAITKLAQISVAMARNQHISKTADLFFLPPQKLEIVWYNFETALKDYVAVHVALFTKHNGEMVPFTSCDNLHFALDFSNEIFHIDSNNDAWPLQGNACRLIRLKATALGNTQLRVSYTFGETVLKDEVTLVVFDKLAILNPQSNEVVLPIGSSRNVIYQNGPQKLFNIAAELKSVSKYDRKLIDVAVTPSKDHHIFNILCKRVGETVLSFELYNSLSTTNYVPYISKIVTQVFCVKPRFINLYTTEKLRESCPLKAKNSLMHVKRTDDNLEVGIEVLDAENRKLMNITSLTVDWQFVQTNEKKSTASGNVLHQRETETEIIAGVSVPLRDYLLSAIPNIQSSYKIKGTVVSYDRKVLQHYGITPESPEFGIKKVSLIESFI